MDLILAPEMHICVAQKELTFGPSFMNTLYVVSISNYLGDDMTLHAFTKFSPLAKIYLAHCESKLL